MGQVTSVSSGFCTAGSILHSATLVSSVIKKFGTLCTARWDGRDPRFAELLYVPRHLQVGAGDTVLTSGFNSVFPEGTLVGLVESAEFPENESFLKVRIELSTDFAALDYVYLVRDRMASELDSLKVQ